MQGKTVDSINSEVCDVLPTGSLRVPRPRSVVCVVLPTGPCMYRIDEGIVAASTCALWG